MGRQYRNQSFSLEADPITLWAKAAIGATGAPTLSTTRSKGIASIARTGAGAYTLTLGDKYRQFLFLKALVQNATAPTSVACYLVAEDVDGAGTLQVVFVDEAGVAVELDDGATVYFELVVQRTAVGG